MFDRIQQSLDAMMQIYAPGAKSRHWQKFFTDKTIAALRDRKTLSAFRSNSLKQDLHDQTSWLGTAHAFKRLTVVTGGWIRKYSEMTVGKPKVRRVAGIPVDWHELTLCHYLWTISQNVINPRIVVEIGGGYGGLAHKLKLHFPLMGYVCFDLPEALTLQAFYLSELWPDARFYLFADMEEGKPYASEQYDFTLLPGWFSKLTPAKSVDLFINTRSMMEMNRDTIANYFSDIQRAAKIGGAFFNANRYRKDTVGEPICFRDYPYDDQWSVKISGPSFFQSHVHELLTVREREPSDAVKRTLSSLPSNAKLQKPSTRLSLRESVQLLPLWL